MAPRGGFRHLRVEILLYGLGPNGGERRDARLLANPGTQIRADERRITPIEARARGREAEAAAEMASRPISSRSNASSALTEV
jgi:hypothetical protein